MNEEQDLRLIKLKLDDDLIKDVNSSGDEKLRLAFTIDDKEVHIRFPAYGHWDQYVTEVAQLLVILAHTANELPLEGIQELDQDKFQIWASLASIPIRYKKCRELIETIFFKYLRPEVKGLEFPKLPPMSEETRNEPYMTEELYKERFYRQFQTLWLKTHMDMSYLFIMFTSILYIEDWFKKKAQEVLRKTFPSLTQQSSKGTLQKNATQTSPQFIAGQPFEFDSSLPDSTSTKDQ